MRRNLPALYPVTDAERMAGTDIEHQADVIGEYEAALQRVIGEVIGPDWALVSVKEIEDLVYQMENEPAALARRFATMRRQLKRHADKLQSMSDYDQLRADVERMRESVNGLLAREAV